MLKENDFHMCIKLLGLSDADIVHIFFLKINVSVSKINKNTYRFYACTEHFISHL